MAVCKDWIGSLRRASYRGVSFFVETDQISTGRRLHVHEFPHSNLPYVEDLGRKANTISVTAYLTGDNVGSLEGSLRKACDAGGPARLNLPMARCIAHCDECSRDYRRDQLGYIAFSIKFVVEGSRPAPFSGLNSARAIEFAAGKIKESLAVAFSRTFKGIGVPGFVADAAVEQIRTVAASFDVAIRQAPITPEVAGPLIASAASLSNDAPALILVGDRGDRYTATSFVSEAETELGSELVDAVSDLFESARGGLEGVYAAEFLTPWMLYEPDASTDGLSQSAITQRANDKALVAVVKATAAAQYAAALALRPYADRRQAIQARADAAEYFEEVIKSLSGWETYAVWVELTDLAGKTAELLTRLVTDLAPVLEVSTARRMPSLWWANRLYGDASRAGELATRNGVKHASFMPISFEALSR